MALPSPVSASCNVHLTGVRLLEIFGGEIEVSLLARTMGAETDVGCGNWATDDDGCCCN